MSLILTVIVSIGIVLLLGIRSIFWIRSSASKNSATDKRWWTFVPANAGALVVGKQNENERDEATGTVVTSGGGVLDFIHSIPGMRADKKNIDPGKWKMVRGEEDYGFIHWITGGAFFLGPFKELRNCTIHEFRISKVEAEDESGITSKKYEISSKDYETLFPYYSGAIAIAVREAEVKGNFRVNLDINILYERKFFVRSVLRVADANAILTLMVESEVIGIIGPMEPEAVLSGDKTVKLEIAEAVNGINRDTEKQIGLSVFSARVFDLSVNKKDQELFELEERTKRQLAVETQKAETEREIASIKATGVAKAIIIKATADREAGILVNDVPADFAARVTLKIAENPLAVTVRGHEAYENNETVVVFGGGGPISQMLPAELIQPKKVQAVETETVVSV